MAATPTEEHRSADKAPSRQDLERLFAMEHPDPHSILGAHPQAQGTIVRAFRPDAEQVNLIPDHGPAQAMMRRPGTDLFETLVQDAEPGFPYRLEIVRHHGGRIKAGDPYRFLPTLGEMDLYLFREQTMERPWEKMGANPMVAQGAAGVSFA